MTTSGLWGVPIKWDDKGDAYVYMTARTSGKTHANNFMIVWYEWHNELPDDHEANLLDDL